MRRTILALTVLIALLAAMPASAPAHFGEVPADSAQKRKKPKKCKKGKVRVKVGKKSACRPFKKAFPKPKAGDPRKLATQAVLGRDLSKLRSRRGKRMPSLPKLIRKVGPGADKLLQKALTRGLARLDAMEAAASASRVRAAQSDCGNQAVPRQRDNVTIGGGGGGGPSATVGVELGPDGANLGIEVSNGEMSVKADIDMGLCDPNQVEAPSCATAVGRLQGGIRYRMKVNIQVSRGAENVWSQGAETVRRTKLDGFTDVDAKLDRLNVEDVETSTLSAGGTSRDYPPMSIRTSLVRRTEVDMRSGAYDPGNSQLDVTISMEGLYGPDRDEAEAEVERRGREDADRQWRAVIDEAIDGYRTREDAWQTPNVCASMQLSPVRNSLTLRGGASGSFDVTVIAKEGGGQSEMDGRLSDQQNAIFEPSRAGGQRAQFGYSNVAPATAPGQKVSAKVRATSKAGVAEDTWEQNMEPPFLINQIAGNFSGEITSPVGPRTARISWTGSARFDRTTPPTFPGAAGSYMLEAGQVSIHYSGGSLGGDALCDMTGSTFVDLFQHAGGSIGVSPVDPVRIFEQGPHTYSGLVTLGFGPTVTITETNCADPNHNNTTHVLPVGALPAFDTGLTERTSPDAIDYSGSTSRSEGGVTISHTWAMTGSRAP